MARSPTSYLGYPMKTSQLFEFDNIKSWWNDSLDNPMDTQDFDAMTTLLSIMRARAKDLGYGMSSYNNCVRVRHKGEVIFVATSLKMLVRLLTEDGLLEDDIGLSLNYRFECKEEE